jgi:glycosyltransferase involved in cell wall biosynthesis
VVLNLKVAIITTYAHKVFTARKELINDIIKKGLEVYIMGPEKKEMCPSNKLDNEMTYIELNIERNNLNPLKEIYDLYDIKMKLESNNIDFVLVYGIRMIPSVVIAAKLAKVKRIVCIINGAGNLFMSKGVKGELIKFISFPMLRLGLSYANSVIFQNQDDYKDLKQQGLINKKNICFTNGSGVNSNLYKQFPLPENLEFLLVSRITGSKGINEYVNAAKIVKSKYPRARFGLVGPRDDNDGSVDWNNLNEAIKNNIVQYYGETDDVVSYLRNSRIYVFPSYYREGVPRSVLEAMAVGRPIITTHSPGCRETVEDGINGFLIPPKNIEALVEKIIWMIENPKRVELMANESRRIVVNKFDVNKVNKIIIEQLSM